MQITLINTGHRDKTWTVQVNAIIPTTLLYDLIINRSGNEDDLSLVYNN